MEKEESKEILGILEREDDFLITSHIHPDGDALGSQLALFLFLKKMQKRCQIINQDPVPLTYTFLPAIEEIYLPQKAQGSSRVACVLDCLEFKRIGEGVVPLVKSCQQVLNIDHHPGESEFRGLNLNLPPFSSTSEILYELLSASSVEMDHDIAMCLYTGILADTGSFGYASVTPRTHLVVADLLKYGLDIARISDLVYRVESPKMIRLLSIVYETLKVEEKRGIAYVLLTREMLSRAGLKKTSLETEFILRQIRRLEGVKVCIFFYEMKEGEVKISLRSDSEIDVNIVARRFSGGGHQRAAGCVIYDSLEVAIQRCLQEVRKNL